MCVKLTDLPKEILHKDVTRGLSVFIHKTMVIILLSKLVNPTRFDPKDALLDFEGLAIKYTGACEEHSVTTEDGYVMKLFRIPGNNSRPVLLMHGLVSSSDDFIVRGNGSYGSTLHKAGYDVWFGNYRGNKYSRRHVTLNPDKNRVFWKFGAQEHGYYDLAASIDYILNKTGEKVSLIAHSQGTMITYILGSERPEYNNKIKVFIALAPVCHIHHVREKLPKEIALLIKIRNMLQLLQIDELRGYDKLFGNMQHQLCSSTMGRRICRKVVFIVNGYDPDGLELDFIPIIMRHFPAGTSRQNLEHFLQMIELKRFANYDYGPAKNLEIYGTRKSPEYDLRKVTMDTYLFAAKNDPLSLLIDTNIQARELPNVKKYIVIENDMFTHIDHLWSRRATELVHPKVLDILEIYH